MTNKINFIFALGLLILLSLACSFNYSTAKLGEIKFGKEKTATPASTTFNPNDEIFAVTSIDNSIGNTKLKFRLLNDKVEGAAAGTVAYKIEKDLPSDGSGPVWLNFSVPGGFAPGTYKVEAVLTGDDGKEFDRKTNTFTISGSSAAKPAASATEKEKTSDDSDDN